MRVVLIYIGIPLFSFASANPPECGKELAILQRGRENLKKAILLFVNNSQLVKTNLKKGA